MIKEALIISFSIIDWGPKEVRVYAHKSDSSSCYVQVPKKTLEVPKASELLEHLIQTECVNGQIEED